MNRSYSPTPLASGEGNGPVGLTTTIPVEVLLAAGRTPLDLNNALITAPDPCALVARAERDGYPANVCGWIKGIYGVVLEHGIRQIVAVTQGDCSQTHAMAETLQAEGVEVIPFAYPFDRDRGLLRAQIERLMERFGVGWGEVEQQYEVLHPARRTVAEIDELNWRSRQVTGAETHRWQVSCSDFGGDPTQFLADAQAFADEARTRPATNGDGIRLGLAGVPPIYGDFFEVLEEDLGARIVHVEVPRQFSLPWAPETDLVTCYQRYTYPYDIFGRLEDLKAECARRQVDGLIHYAQSFCFRQIEDLLIKREMPLPVLTLEGDRPGPVDARTRIRMEAFLESVDARRSGAARRDPV
ncbi:MAG: 2-hydroxyacyl-CoA dehydratase [Armatimonadetes bacterium]|nr:2-hydroxyacyl-CoA dehydratase [Armatimonadota bacterium]